MPVEGKIGECHRVVRVASQNLFEQYDRFVAILSCKSLDVPMRTHHPFPLTELRSFLAVDALNFCSDDSRRDSTNDALGDLVLNGKNIFERAVVTLRPDVVAIACVDQLRRDAHTVTGLAHA